MTEKSISSGAGELNAENQYSIAHYQSLHQLEGLIHASKNRNPSQSYTAKLYRKGRAKIAEKVGEEAIELVIAAIQDDKGAIKSEAADLLFHMMVLLADAGLGLADVIQTLKDREGQSGLDEKASRPRNAD